MSDLVSVCIGEHVKVMETEEPMSLSSAKLYWLMGEWDKLSAFNIGVVKKSQEHANLVLLAGSACQHLGYYEKAKSFFNMAMSWGCSTDVVAKVLISDVFYTLGGIAALCGYKEDSKKFYKESVELVENQNIDLYCHSRLIKGMTRLGLLPDALRLLDEEIKSQYSEKFHTSKLDTLKVEIDLLHHELLLAQKRSQLFKIDSESNTKNLSNRSVSQLGQDLWVLQQTNYMENGFFVEFGATDGILLSNSYLLETEFSWSGICAEPNPIFLKKLKQNRKCIISNECISGYSGEEVEFVFADAFGGMIKHASDDMHEDKRHAYQNLGQTAILTTISLHDFLLKHNAPKKIDYLSIDTEGSEYEIISEFPFDEWDVRCLTVEHNFTDNRAKLRRLLEGFGYKCKEQQWDDWYYLEQINE